MEWLSYWNCCKYRGLMLIIAESRVMDNTMSNVIKQFIEITLDDSIFQDKFYSMNNRQGI